MKLAPLVTGRTSPSVAFWLVQFGALTALNVLSPLIYFLFVAAMVGKGSPLIFTVAFTATALFVAAAWILHFAAIWRASRHAKTKAGRLATLAYPPALLLFFFVLLPGLIRSQGGSLRNKARQSEAKALLSAVYEGEKRHFAELGAYAPSLEATGYQPSSRGAFYGMALLRCQAEKPSRPDLKIPAALRGGANIRHFVESTLRDQAGKETCAGREQGFTAWAAGQLSPGAPLDIWRIDEQRKMENIVSGL